MTAMDPAVTGELGRAHPLAQYIGDFLTDLANVGASGHTLRAYCGDPGLPGQTSPAWRHRRASASGRRWASFCRWAVRHDLLGANPMDKLGTIKVPRRLLRPAAAADVATVLAVICRAGPARR
jgi:integrase/recombinase XerD